MDSWLDFSEFVDKIQEQIDLGLFDDALKLLNQYEQTFSDEWELYFLFSRLFAEQNKPEKALPYLHKGLKLDPINVDCLLGLFYANSMLNDVAKGGKYLLRAQKHHPDNELVLSALIWYYTDLNQLTKALGYFEQARAQGTQNPETFRNAGIAFERSGFDDRAENCYKTAIELHPQYDEVRELLSDHYISTGKAAKAVELYKKALVESPLNIRYLSRLVFCLSQNNQADEAVKIAEESIKLYPNSPIGYVDLSYVKLNSGHFDDALLSADKALDIAPIDAEAYRIKGIVFSEKGEFSLAGAAFESSRSLDPENPEILRDYYHHLRNIGEYEKMEAMVNDVIRLEYPVCSEDYWFLADFFREQKSFLKAFQYLHKAFKLRPSEFELLPLMAEILLEKGHSTLAFAFLNRYVEKAGWNELMDQFALHKNVASKKFQESLRFLRFSGQSRGNYRRYLFNKKLLRVFLICLVCLIIFSAFPLYVSFGLKALYVLIAASALAGSGILIYFAVQRQKKLLDLY